MAESETCVTVLEQFSVAPPPGKVAGLSLPLTLFDIKWVHVPPMHGLIFYEHKTSKTDFVQSIIPHLRHSLSLSLQYYPLMAAKLTVPRDYSTPPEIQYGDGNTVPLVFAVWDKSDGFEYLTLNHARNCRLFHSLAPNLPRIRVAEGEGEIQMAMFAVQVTLFPDAGICVGITNHHTVGDSRRIIQFMKAWSKLSILWQYKKSSLSGSLPVEFQPFLDRSVIKDPKGLKNLMWNNMKHIKIEDTLPSVMDKARATFVVTRHDIQILKRHVVSLRPGLLHPSSFVVTCAYTWTCLLKSKCVDYDVDDDDDTVYFICPADCRARLDSPVPANYFGNCLTTCIANAKPKKFEVASIDYTGAISLSCCRDSETDLEIGISIPVTKMHILKTLFYQALKALL